MVSDPMVNQFSIMDEKAPSSRFDVQLANDDVVYNALADA